MLNKREVLENFIRIQEERIKQMEASLGKTQRDARESPGSNVSHSDTMKFQFSNLALGIQKRISEANEAIRSLRQITIEQKTVGVIVGGSLIGLKNTDTDEVIFYMFIPEKGGELVEIDGQKIMSVSVTAPLFNAVRGKKKGDELDFKGKTIEIIEVQ